MTAPRFVTLPCAGVHPAIPLNNYRVDRVEVFAVSAPRALVQRYLRDCPSSARYVLWDENDDADGYLIAGDSVGALNDEFLRHFGDDIEVPA